MRQSRIAAGACSLLLAAACAFAAPATAQAPRTVAGGYVALGDSYSSGVGAGDYLASGKECKRSSRAFPVLWAEAHAPASFSFAACNGAGAKDVLTEQLGHLSTRTGLVTLTVGGHDSGFVGVLATCALGGAERCLSAVSRSRAMMDGSLSADLDRLYTAIRSRAPAARVVVLGYPHLYHLSGSCALGLPDGERATLNDAVDHLNAVIAQRAAVHGFTFADVTAAFAGHEICSSHPWLHSVDVFSITESYHPTAPGQSLGYLPALTQAS
ncbi:SGNH/GDSL hydrolase family protein [Streptomyces sp. 5-8]|uniref:SGNH/GDSL hydrolase family protein n=1 Tax=Streptomyces musisoli TaxID=2802280 RepID=A0ABS1NZF0_9ACTN|nr:MULTISPECIES: SGNH/GDSL hydrolase family protein [Streptomyces]MBL1105056.1 SGNH/GDSL hydrolase family protein [Streptomyces musisoli]MBY8841144.1 SGNH/GDSL hydrolase family protein [Streptomyces sp. SP2-10]